MSSSMHIAKVPYSVVIEYDPQIDPVEDNSEFPQLVCLEEGGSWDEVEWGSHSIFLRELNEWILNKTAKDLKGIRDGYDPFCWEYTKGDMTVAWISNSEDDEGFIFSSKKEDLEIFLKDYGIKLPIYKNAEVQIYL